MCVTEKHTKKAIPISERGLPESVWVGICQYSKLESPRIGLGFIPIWGPIYTLSALGEFTMHSPVLGDITISHRSLVFFMCF
jgi:hypothetical protein